MLQSSVRRFATAVSKKTPTPAVPKKHRKQKKNRFVKAGLPLMLFIVGGYMGLTQFVGGKYEARDHLIKSQSQHTFDLEEEHKKMTQKLVLDDFELKPVPKPKEE
ncbi:hypothetical protein BBO99_00007210 [Phytophthora kernoviae]|uniref:Uncharacterized protein n=2 Tax=Phytophthora kernoviae TaxID=325452 RepID=A0A421EXQ0_9STRA|nr:hypothetical protein G195_009641 [Phytophthora kernoviae 00238/432]KAG2523063.1 hypothetical protein JM18_005910 [Phytophthora kernoviae]KAG2524566.1 hypothetical protein JM16_003622 [Phytophthora kernoviae]RLN10206.1 hypothetical protein BBI17_004091 [Phytophthora kernoviae]RLN76877.1 hypothetical protein BBO99_00007210 [Phytophthora kernoviae]